MSAKVWDSYARSQALNIEMARKDPAHFARFVLRDELTGKLTKPAPMHKDWHDNLTANRRSLFWAHTEAGKTQQLSIARALYEIGRNPNLRVVIVSNTTEQAKKIVRSIGQYISKSAELHAVFPGLVKARDKSLPWTSQMLTVERTSMGKDPTIQAVGIHGNITGARIDVLILDDILDYENTRTPGPRDDLWKWILSTLIGRPRRSTGSNSRSACRDAVPR